MIDIGYFRAIQGTVGVFSEAEYKAEEAKRRLQRELESSINYCTALRNGVKQNFVITASEVKYKYNIIAMPDDELHVGDMIDHAGEHFLVVQTRAVSPIQIVGQLWLCNYLMRFQNFDNSIIERWCVFDSGQYSSSVSGDSTIVELSATRKIYISEDEHTEKIFVDKRIAVDTMYNQYGEKILECYKIVGRSKKAKTYGNKAHMITFTVESSLYNEATDNINEMICDYVGADTPAHEELNAKCVVLGRSTIPLGGTRIYTPGFYDEFGDIIHVDDVVWNVNRIGLIFVDESTNKCKLSVGTDESLVGEIITLSLRDSAGVYKECVFEIEVVS